MALLPAEHKQKIALALDRVGAMLPCPRCSNQHFTLADGYVTHNLQSELSGLTIGRGSIPTVVVVCNRCGYLAQHALTVLPLPQEGDEKK